MMYPDYQRVDNPEAIARFEKFWGRTLDHKPGLTVVEIMDAACEGRIKGMYIMGENPAMSDPNAHHAREGLASLDMLVVQDIFLTETAYLADVVLPASAWPEKTGTVTNTDRMVQLGRRALDMPGDARQDLWIIQQLANRLGCGWNYSGPGERCRAGVRRDAPGDEHHQRHHLGAPARSSRRSPIRAAPRTIRASRWCSPRISRPRTAAASSCPPTSFPPTSAPTPSIPFVLITGRQLEHWHTGSMTRRASVLDAHRAAGRRLDASARPRRRSAPARGDVITVASRRGEIALTARADDGTPRGGIFIPFAFYEAAANLLTNAALDPFGKIAEVKYCAVKVRKGGDAAGARELRRRPVVQRKGVIRPRPAPGRRSSAKPQIVGFFRIASKRSMERTVTSWTSVPLSTLSVTSTPGAPVAHRRV